MVEVKRLNMALVQDAVMNRDTQNSNRDSITHTPRREYQKYKYDSGAPNSRVGSIEKSAV